MERDTVVDGVRRECLRLVAQALVQAEVGDELRQAVIDRTAVLVDALVLVVARHTANASGREARTVAEVVFVHLWPVVTAEYIPAIVVGSGGPEKVAQCVRNAMEASRQEMVDT